MDPPRALADIVAGARVEQNAGDAALQALSSPLMVDCGLAGEAALQTINSPAVVEVVVSGVQPSLGDVVPLSKLAGIPPAMEDPSVLWSSNIAHSPLPLDSVNDVAELVPILPEVSVAKSGDFVCRPMSLPCVGRHQGLNLLGAVPVRVSILLLFSKEVLCCKEAMHV